MCIVKFTKSVGTPLNYCNPQSLPVTSALSKDCKNEGKLDCLDNWQKHKLIVVEAWLQVHVMPGIHLCKKKANKFWMSPLQKQICNIAKVIFVTWDLLQEQTYFC